MDQIERSFLDPRLHNLANPTERRTSKTMRADINVRSIRYAHAFYLVCVFTL